MQKPRSTRKAMAQTTAMAMMAPWLRPEDELWAAAVSAAAELVAEGVELVVLVDNVVEEAEVGVGVAESAALMTDAAPAAWLMKSFRGFPLVDWPDAMAVKSETMAAGTAIRAAIMVDVMGRQPRIGGELRW